MQQFSVLNLFSYFVKSCILLRLLEFWLINVGKLYNNLLVYKKGSIFVLNIGGGKKARSSASFSPVISTDLGINPENFLTFIFDPFPTIVQCFKSIPPASPKLLNLNQDNTSKNCFLVKSL